MGMPVSSYTVYTVLRELASGGESYEIETARRALAPFNLFAFILHDPAIHKVFHMKLSRLFDRLDFITGHKLLFFALVDPPDEWLTHSRGRDYYRLLDSWETRRLLDPSNAVVSADKSATAFSVSAALRIPNEGLPAIVVTHDFRSQKFQWVRTCPEHLEEQLTRLGYMAARDIRPAYTAFPRLVDVDLCGGRGAESLSNSLAKALSDLLSFIVASRSSDLKLQRAAQGQARDTLDGLYSALQDIKSSDREGKSEDMERLCVSIVAFLSHLNTKGDLSLSDFIPLEQQWLENDSYQILRTAHKVFRLLASDPRDQTLPVSHTEALDYTPCVICLAKVFEREANLSVVHWIRKELGISLPQFFNKHQPGVRAALIPAILGGREINFNKKGRQDKWIAPGIGESELGCKELSKRRLPSGWDQAAWDLLLNLWRVIREKRNEAVHTEMMDRESLLVVKGALEDLSKNHLFEKFYKMKAEYRGTMIRLKGSAGSTVGR